MYIYLHFIFYYMQPRVCNTRPVECGQSLVARPCSGLASALHANATPPTTPQYKQYPVYSTSPPYTISIDRVTLIYTTDWTPASSGCSMQCATPDILALNPDYICVERV